MTVAMSQEQVYDFRGEDCPGPLMKAIRRVWRSPIGSVTKVLTDNEKCVKLIKEMAADLMLGSVTVEDKGDYMLVIIRREG